MKTSPILSPVIVALTAGVAFTVGYALIENPASTRTPSILSPASVPEREDAVSESAETVFPGEPKLLTASLNSGQETPREGQGSAQGEPFRADQQGIEATPAQPVSTGMASEPPTGIQPANVALPIQPDSPGTVAEADDSGLSALVPLAFRPLPPEVAAANPQLADAVRGLQQNFIDAVGGGPDQNPNDPAYYQRWTAAEANINEQYRLLVGDQKFLIEQMAVNNR